MEYQQLKYVSTKASKIVMGTMVLSSEKQAESFALLDDIFALGVNTFDTAAVYPNNGEAVLTSWIADRGIRDQIVLLTKGAHHNQWRQRVTPFDIMADAQDSLSKPGADFIDIFMLHRDDPSVSVGAIVEILNRLVDGGKIKSFGGSNWSVERIQAANEYAEKYGLQGFSSVSPHFSLAEQVQDPWGGNCVTLTGADQAVARAYYQENQMPVFAYSSLGRGFLSGRVHSDDFEGAKQVMDPFAQRGYLYDCNMQRLARAEQLAKELNASIPQIALAYIFNNPLNAFALVGAETKEQMADNLKAMELKLTEQQVKWLNLDA